MSQVIITQGLPASGKTTWAKQYAIEHEGVVRINNDDLSESLFTLRDVRSRSKMTGAALHNLRKSMLKALLKTEGVFTVIVDNTNLQAQAVNTLADIAMDLGAEVVLNKTFLDVPLQTCLDRNALRDHPVPESVIISMAGKVDAARKVHLRTRAKVEPYKFTDGLPDAYIADIDGTLALRGNRGIYDETKVDLDMLNEPVAELLGELYANGVAIVLMSGRGEGCREATVEWLNDYKVKFDALHMRPQGDMRRDSEVKYELFCQYVADEYNVLGVFDDRDQVVNLWRNQLRIPTYQVADGDF